MAVILHAINGIGLGHLSRQVQIAQEVRRIMPDAAMYFLTSAEWHGWLREERFPFYYVPSAPEYRTLRESEELSPDVLSV